ncbi:MAG: hypothetical protein KDE09_20820 [Anaerolineales bacterium]|nr:hypothetical protein [Anaerolineales bacterium]
MKNSESPTLMFGKYGVNLTDLSQARPPTVAELEELVLFRSGCIYDGGNAPIMEYESTATAAFSYVAVFDNFQQYAGYEGKMMVVVGRTNLHHPDTYIWRCGKMEKTTPDAKHVAPSNRK